LSFSRSWLWQNSGPGQAGDATGCRTKSLHLHDNI
jgi:hypothetical protein